MRISLRERGASVSPSATSPLRTAMMGVLALAAVVLPFVLSSFVTFQLSMALIYAIAALSIVLLTGMNGQIALGHGAFFGLGAYTTAILVQNHGWHFLLTMPVGALLCFVLGVLIGIPALRLRGAYLAVLTLSVAFLFPLVIKRFNDFTGGSSGMTISQDLLDAPEWSGLSRDRFHYFLALLVLIVLLVLTRNLLRGRTGRAIVGIRDNEIAAITVGIHLPTVKTITFGISAAFAGVAGCLYTVAIAFVSSDAFPVQMSINFLIGAVVGGLYNIYGAIIGGLVLEFLPQYSQSLSPSLTAFVYGAALIVILLVMPGGAAALIGKALDGVGRLVSGRRPDSGESTVAVPVSSESISSESIRSDDDDPVAPAGSGPP